MIDGIRPGSDSSISSQFWSHVNLVFQSTK